MLPSCQYSLYSFCQFIEELSDNPLLTPEIDEDSSADHPTEVSEVGYLTPGIVDTSEELKGAVEEDEILHLQRYGEANEDV